MIPIFFLFGSITAETQNSLEKKILADNIETILINGNQIFTISISTSKTDYITIKSVLDGEYQNQFQIVTLRENKTLQLSLEHLSLNDIPDDKRNAHKVIAATLHLEIPENLSLNILSDIGSVDLSGNFNTVFIELLQGHFDITGDVKSATINTIDGDINIVTQSATIDADSNNGTVVLDEFTKVNSTWKLKTINGDITVIKPE